ncbi:hydrogenase maturation nickel metallochaperone HypA [Betaproteobacteria bacterium PRO7]|jgi:hydrogenase nickel incorporation protein HypA/HybF|nr:hydrogenase maturation nickel metallochaperone HypA [Betaproteobacteria bacterium PRO7]
MHEMSLAESVLGAIEEAARAQRFGGVKTVRLEIGRLAAVELDALRFAFDVVKRGGVADGARLDIVEVPGAAWCMRCCEVVPLSARGDACPRCGGFQMQVSAGEELRVKELEVV